MHRHCTMLWRGQSIWAEPKRLLTPPGCASGREVWDHENSQFGRLALAELLPAGRGRPRPWTKPAKLGAKAKRPI